MVIMIKTVFIMTKVWAGLLLVVGGLLLIFDQTCPTTCNTLLPTYLATLQYFLGFLFFLLFPKTFFLLASQRFPFCLLAMAMLCWCWCFRTVQNNFKPASLDEIPSASCNFRYGPLLPTKVYHKCISTLQQWALRWMKRISTITQIVSVVGG